MDKWGPFEIILGLVLVIGILNAIGKNPGVAPVGTPTDTQKTVQLSEKDKWCGLSITTPLSKEIVSTNVRVSGSIQGCKWQPNGTTALYAQVINKKGEPVSSFVTVPITAQSATASFFDTTIDLVGVAPGSGTLILIPATPQKETSISVRIPLQFIVR